MKKLLTVAILMVALLVFPTSSVFAQESTPITGTVESVTWSTDETTGETIVVLTLTDETGAAQTLNLSLETAQALGLVNVDETTGEITVNEETTQVTIDPAVVLPSEGEGEEEEEAEHPVGSKLGEYFGELLGVEYDVIMEQKEQGFGFGVIAQALWLTNQIDGDTETFTALLEAKKSGDYSNIVLADGSTPQNWGDVVTSLKKGENLGAVMSGKANADDADEENDTESADSANGRGNGKGKSGSDSGDTDKGQGKGNNGNGNGKGNNGNGKGNGNGNGGGKP